MQDSRVLTKWETQVGQQVAACQTWASESEKFIDYVNWLSGWLRENIKNGQNPKLILENFGENLRDQIILLSRSHHPEVSLNLDQNLIDGITYFFFQEGAQNDYAEWLIGASFAKLCLSRPKDLVSLATAWVFVNGPPIVFHGFLLTVQKERRKNLDETIIKIINLVTSKPECFVYSMDRDAYLSTLEFVQKSKSVAISWNYERCFRGRADCQFLSLLKLTQITHVQRFVDTLSDFKNPDLVSYVVDVILATTGYDEFLQILRKSNICFQNNNWNGSFLSPILLDSALAYFSKLDSFFQENDTSYLEEFRSVELPKLVDQLCDTLLSRIDGIPLAISWFAYLLHRSSHFSSPNRTKFNINDKLIETIINTVISVRGKK